MYDKIIQVIQDMCDEVRMTNKSVCVKTEGFTMKGIVQRPALSLYSFSLVIDQITKDV